MRYFVADLRAKQRLYASSGSVRGLFAIAFTDGTIANFLVRLQAFLVDRRLAPLAYPCHLANKWLNGCVIGIRARFGPGLVLIHPIGIVINSNVTAGDNVLIESGVVIGDKEGATPTIGSNVFIGSGAKLIGRIHVGDGARIGANAVVVRDVLPGQTIVGIPGRAVRSRCIDHPLPLRPETAAASVATDPTVPAAASSAAIAPVSVGSSTVDQGAVAAAARSPVR